MKTHRHVSGPEVRPGNPSDGIPPSASRVARAVSQIGRELKAHVPFTLFGTLTGIAILALFVAADVPRWLSTRLFWSAHPLHVLLSAQVTTAMFTLHSRRSPLSTLVIGYLGSVGVATVSDCVIPYVGEMFMDLPNRGIHLGFVEKWWLVNPLAVAGIALGCLWPRTKVAHAGHVLLSTWASLFHMTMAMGSAFGVFEYAATALFLFLAVWIPCCTSDIVFPLLFARK